MKQFLPVAAMAALSLCACKKNNDPAYNPSTMADLSVEFDNVAGDADLHLNTGTVTNAAGEALQVTRLMYYVSNFVLTNANGNVYTVPQDSCYFLIDESDETTHEPVLHLPEGEYKTLRFLIGVDSLRSTKDISQRTGVLDPTAAAADMYWGPNSGYIFFKMEGTSPASPAEGNVFLYHIGGFGGYSSPTINNLKTVTLDLTNRGTPKVKAGKETNIHLFVDILKVFNGASSVSIGAHPVVMFDDFSTTIANNYASMFRHDHTEN